MNMDMYMVTQAGLWLLAIVVCIGMYYGTRRRRRIAHAPERAGNTFCPDCGKVVVPSTRFCGECEARIAESSTNTVLTSSIAAEHGVSATQPLSTTKAALITLAIILPFCLFGLYDGDAALELVGLVVLGISIWAAMDSSRLRLREYSTQVAHPVVLFLGMSLLWIVIFPWYLVVRSKIRGSRLERQEHPNRFDLAMLWVPVGTLLVVMLVSAAFFMRARNGIKAWRQMSNNQLKRPVSSGDVGKSQTRDPAEEVLSKLKPGRITYNPPHEMKVAVPTSIEVRIGKLEDSSPDSGVRLNAALTKDLERPALAPEPIRVSTTMKAILTGSKDEFQIDLKSPEEQIISIDEPTEWRWSVTPLKAGKRRLHLSAIAVLKLEGTEKVKEYGVFDTDINVRVNLIQFVTEHWKEISSAASGTGLIGWLLARFQKRKKQARSKRRKANA